MSVDIHTYANENQYFQEVIDSLGKKDIRVISIENEKNWPDVSLAIEVMGAIGDKNTGDEMDKYRIVSLKRIDKG